MRMTIEKPMPLNSEDESNLVQGRLVLLMAGLLYPMWGVILQSLHFEGTQDSLVQRILIGSFGLIWIALSYRFHWVKLNFSIITAVTLHVGSLHFFYLLYVNQLHPVYLISTVVVAVIVGTMLQTRWQLIHYGVFVMSCAVLATVQVATMNFEIFYLLVLATAVFMVSFATDRRIQMLSREKNIRHELEDTMKKMIEAEKLLAKQQAEISNASRFSALGEMAGGVAHEINNPLTTISLLASEIDEISAADGQKSEVNGLAQKIVSTVDRISRIVRSLRHFSRDGRDEAFQLISLESLLDGVLTLCRARFKNSGVELTLDLKTAHKEIECRPVQISQVLLNLLNNAYDAVLASETPRKVHIEGVETQNGFSVRISNNGLPIPPSVRPRIFDPFFTTKEIGKGTGLGLSLSRGVVESHGGVLYLDESTARTLFVMEIPRRQGSGLANKAS